MFDSVHQRAVFFKLFVFLVAYLTVTGWALSGIHHLRWIGVMSLPGLVAVVVLARRWLAPFPYFWRSLGEPLAFWPFLLVAGLALMGQMFYPPTMLDSLTYRLPQLFIWLQNDDLRHFLSAEDRLNYMPETWGLATLPLVQLAGDQLVWCWNFGSWIVLYLLAYDWALAAGNDRIKSRILAFIASTSLLAVLQAASSANDLFAGVMALLALRFVMDFEQSRNGSEIHWAVLSFCLAAGTKPHFAVFGLPLALWFFAAPSKPWQVFRWAWLPALLVVWLLCSPVPSFVMNFQTYGSWSGPGQNETIRGKSPVRNILLGTIMIVWQNLQPPLNPVAPVVNQKLDQMVNNSGLKKFVPRFNLRIAPISLVDSAALGLVTSVLFMAGVVTALRRNPRMWRSWQAIALGAGLLCIGLALSRFVSASAGRAYCGFVYLALPLAVVGWSLMRPGTLKWAMYLSLGSSLVAVILYPGHPLWPVRRVQQEFAASPRFHRLAEQLKPYVQYSERAVTGEDLMRVIPADELQVVLLVGEDRPLLPLFRPYSLKRRLLFLPTHATPQALNQLGSRYVVVGGGAEGFYPELCDYLQQTNDYQLVARRDYTSKLARGPEPWLLYQSTRLTNAAASASR